MEKFEVGDKVKLVRLDIKDQLYIPSMGRFLGKTGTVESITCFSEKPMVRFDNNEVTFVYPTDWLELVEKKKKGWTGQVVCTAITGNCGEYFIPGKVYDVRKGLLIDKKGIPYTPTLFNSANDLIAYFETPTKPYRFIEFKGFNENKDEFNL